MKFLECTHCFTGDSAGNPSNKAVQEITNPLVVTKRPVPKVLENKSKGDSSSTSKRRFPGLLSALASWSRRRSRSHKSKKQQQKSHQYPSAVKSNVRRTVRVIEPPAPRRRVRYRPPTRTQRLIRLYEERANTSDARVHQRFHEEFLIDPPASFSGDDSLESHQNFKNKLNTLDFKRMNTVALEEPSPAQSRSESAIYRKNSYVESMSIAKCARKTMLEDFLKERSKIEQTMIDLLNGRDPGSIILKKSRNEDRRVRFKVNNSQSEKELHVDLMAEKKVNLEDLGRVKQDTEIKLSVDRDAQVEDFYVEKTMTYLKDKTVEDKALVVKIARNDVEDTIGMGRSRELVFWNFGKLTL